MGVNEYDRAMDYLQTPGVLSIADVELLHTRVAKSVTYLRMVLLRPDLRMVLVVTLEEEEEEHRAC